MLLKLHSCFKESSYRHNKYLVMSRINKYMLMLLTEFFDVWNFHPSMSLRKFNSMQAMTGTFVFFMRTRAVIKFGLQAASALENTDGEQRALRYPVKCALALQ